MHWQSHCQYRDPEECDLHCMNLSETVIIPTSKTQQTIWYFKWRYTARYVPQNKHTVLFYLILIISTVLDGYRWLIYPNFQGFVSTVDFTQSSDDPRATYQRLWVKYHIDHSLRPGVGVIKPISSVPLFSYFFSISKIHVSYCIWRSYLTGVAAAQLRWHLSNMNVMQII